MRNWQKTISLHFPLQHGLKIAAAIFTSPHCSPIKILNPPGGTTWERLPAAKPPAAEAERRLSLSLPRSLALSHFPPYPWSSTSPPSWTERLHILKQPQAQVIPGAFSQSARLRRPSVSFSHLRECLHGRWRANICALVWGNSGAERGITPLRSRFSLNSCCDLKVNNRCDKQILPLHQKRNWDERNDGWTREIFIFFLSSAFKCKFLAFSVRHAVVIWWL